MKILVLSCSVFFSSTLYLLSDDQIKITGIEKSTAYKELVGVLEAVPKFEKAYPIGDKTSSSRLVRYAHTDQGKETAAALIVLWRRGSVCDETLVEQ